MYSNSAQTKYGGDNDISLATGIYLGKKVFD